MVVDEPVIDNPSTSTFTSATRLDTNLSQTAAATDKRSLFGILNEYKLKLPIIFVTYPIGESFCERW